MPHRQLSSPTTFAYQMLCLVLAIVMMTSSLSAAIFVENDPWIFLLPPYFALMCGLLYWIVGRASHVTLVGDSLEVTRRGRTATFALRDIEAVGASRFTNPERMWLDLRRETELGSRIHFLPPNRWLRFFSQQPLKDDFDAWLARGERVGMLGEDGAAQPAA